MLVFVHQEVHANAFSESARNLKKTNLRRKEEDYEKKAENHAHALKAKAKSNGDAVATTDTSENLAVVPLESSEINRLGTDLEEPKLTQHEKRQEKLYEKKLNMHKKHAAVATATVDAADAGESGKAPVSRGPTQHEKREEKLYEKKAENHMEHMEALEVASVSENMDKLVKKEAGDNLEAVTVMDGLSDGTSDAKAVDTTNSKRRKKEHAAGRQEEKDYEERVELKEKHHEQDAALKTTDRNDGTIPENSIPFIPEDVIQLIPPDETESVNIATSMPAASLYWGIFNNPEACPQYPCELTDVFDPNTEGAILHGAGGIPNLDGKVVLTASLYKTSKGVKLMETSLADSRFGGPFTSPGYFNTGAEVVIGVRSVAADPSDTLFQMSALSKPISSLEDLDEFVQFASFQTNETGFGELMDYSTQQVLKDEAFVHLTRENDVLQVFLETNILN